MKKSYLTLAVFLLISITMLKADDDCNYTKIDPENFTCTKAQTKDQLLSDLANAQSLVDRETAQLDYLKKTIVQQTGVVALRQARVDKIRAALDQLQ